MSNLYFAYGSNLALDQMKDRCPQYDFIESAILADYTLGFTRYSMGRKCGVADVVKASGRQVWGLLFKLTDEDFEKLDQYEGRPWAYDRRVMEVKSTSGKMLEAWVYYVARPEVYVPPSVEYVELIASNAMLHGFPMEYVAEIRRIGPAK